MSETGTETETSLRETLASVERALSTARDREEFFARVVDHVAHPIFVKDRAFRFVLLNRALCDMVGYPREHMLGKTDYDFFPREQSDFFRKKDAEMFNSAAKVVIEEEPITDAEGVVHMLSTTKVPLLGPSGEVTHLVGIIHDITKLKAAEHALQLKNDALAEQVRERTAAVAQLDLLNRELESFSYSVSHDLRAPLRSIDGFSQALIEDYGDGLSDKGKDYLRRVRANAQRMGRLIDDLLALSRVTRAELRREPADLSDMAHAIAADLAHAEPDRPVDVVVADGIVARGDPRLLRIVLENLIGNAWKFTGKRERGRIEIGATEAAGGAPAFFVRDNGAGFDMAYVDKLFRAFTRLHPADAFPGTGIGLATVQRIVHRHGGHVWAKGEEGVGATFYFTVPPRE